MSPLSSSKIIKTKILENSIEYQELFMGFQSNFLSDLYSRYQSLENGNLVLYFERLLHQNILRQKDYDLNFDLSFSKFWENHRSIIPKKNSITTIAKDTYLPKETTRRKILHLTKQKILNKKDKNIGWLPNEQYINSYNLFIQKEIDGVSKLLVFVCKKLGLSFSKEEITEEYKKKFSFYWFHLLSAELEYLKLWSLQLKDLELLFIGLQITNMFATKTKNYNISRSNIDKNSSVIKNFTDSSISATSISEATGISRATCVRKLEILVKLKMISQDKISRRYYLIQSGESKELISQEFTEKITKIFSEFYFICIRALGSRTSG